MPLAKVVFFTSLSQEIASLVVSFAPPGFQVQTRSSASPDDEKMDLVRDADFLLLFPASIADRVLEEARRLKLIQLMSAGYDGMNLSLTRKLGIPVANNGGANSVAVAEQTILLILALYRRLNRYLAAVREGQWPRTGNVSPDTHELEGKTVGIVGFGNIGRQVARRLRAFDALIQYYDPFVSPTEPDVKALDARPVSLEELLKTSDVVTIHTPLSRDTAHLIGAKELAMMKPAAVLINTSRGGIVDQVALSKALIDGTISGAGLDVLEPEPPDPADLILSLDNAIITPHMAGPTYESYAKRARNSFANIQRVWEGKKPLWVARFQ
ncbi:MAG: 2-hydroxyacid dehydrogenase [Chloroflexi bacterium]|nr:2-hydroxyacid dehydrogenase [Chloroflexota bacterium]